MIYYFSVLNVKLIIHIKIFHLKQSELLDNWTIKAIELQRRLSIKTISIEIISAAYSNLTPKW